MLILGTPVSIMMNKTETDACNVVVDLLKAAGYSEVVSDHLVGHVVYTICTHNVTEHKLLDALESRFR